MANPTPPRVSVKVVPAANGPMASASGAKVSVTPARGKVNGAKQPTRKAQPIDQMMSSTRPGVSGPASHGYSKSVRAGTAD